MSYKEFKRAVLIAAGWACENPHCDAAAETVHHFLKRSRFPQFEEDPDNGMATCGRCHSEIERRQREGEDFVELYPIGRYRKMCDKIGVGPMDPVREGASARESFKRVLAEERREEEMEAGQGFLELEP